jgi:hypothetical protein
MKYVDKTKVTFHHGCGFDSEGIDKKPFATFIITDIVQRELIDKICDVMKEYHDSVGEFCNIKIQSEDWDC